MSELASKYLNEEMGGNTSRLNQLSTEQGAELVRRVGSKVEFHKALGTCDYEVIQSSRVYNIVDLMK